MKGAISLGRILGIQVYIHFTFFFIFIWRAYTAYTEGFDTYGILFECFIVAAVFLCVLMHEYGHALAARRYGIPTKQIILLPIGGVAQLERMPQNPKQELVVALAGPMVNVVIAAVLLPVVLIQYPLKDFSEDAYMDLLFNSFTARLLLVNIILIVFNMIPAFPMDGGRVLRALLGFRLSFTQATKIAARIGQVIAIGFIIAGFYYNFFWILIGAFVIFGAEAEVRMIRRKFTPVLRTVSEALSQQFTILEEKDTLLEAVKKISNTNETDILVTANGAVKGVVNKEAIAEKIEEGNIAPTIENIMQVDLPQLSVEDTLEQALQYMRIYNTTVLPVYANDKWIGAIQMNTIAAILTAEKAEN